MLRSPLQPLLRKPLQSPVGLAGRMTLVHKAIGWCHRLSVRRWRSLSRAKAFARLRLRQSLLPHGLASGETLPPWQAGFDSLGQHLAVGRGRALLGFLRQSW